MKRPPPAATRRALLALAACLPLARATGASPPPAGADATQASDGTQPAPADEPPDRTGWRIPGGFEPSRAVWLGWDAGHEASSIELVRALWPQVTLRLLAADDATAERARTLLEAAGAAVGGIEFLTDPQALYFLRDAAVFALGPRDEPGVIDFRWSQYGWEDWCRTRHADDAGRAGACAAAADLSREPLDRSIARLAGATVFRCPLALEGGGLETNGAGTLIANEAYLLQRNPGLGRDAIERELLRLPGLRKVIWLPAGLAEDPQMRATIVGDHVGWGTGGHTDEFVRFADERTVLLAWPDDADAAVHPVARETRRRMRRNAAILGRATDADGRRLHILKVPMPRIVERRVVLSADSVAGWSAQWSADDFPASEGRRQGQPVTQVAVASYLNFVVANGVVLLPDYLPHGTPSARQERVQRVFEQAFPGKALQFVDAVEYNWYGGGLHCATLNEHGPAGSLDARASGIIRA